MKRLRFAVHLPLTAALLAAAMICVVFAGVFAQAGAPVITITQVESSAFPYVTIGMRVTDSAGSAITGLTAADFRIAEDGVPVPPSDFSLDAEYGEPVSIVLALDASVDWQSFGRIQAAAKAMLDSLSPDDQMALVTFSETVDVIHGFTTDRDVLKQSIDSLLATGTFTALNDATLKSVNLATTAPTSRRVVFVVTNSGDNSGASTASAAISQATASQIPIYTFGYGSNAATNALAAMSEATGGKTYDLPDADAVKTTLPAVTGGLRDVAYSLTLYSALKPDNRDHSLSITLTHEGLTAQANTSYVAVSREIGVVVPGISDGQTVVGKVYLVAEVDSASPITSVEYLLNGQPIATVSAPPYSFEWDSTTVNSGAYQLTVRAADNAGNQGETTVTVTVSLPFTVQITADTGRVQVGDDFTVDARVDTPAQIAQVDFLLDSQLVGADTSLPYRFTFDTTPFDAGQHTVTVRAVDTLGRTAESSFDIRFTEALWPIVIRWAFAGLIVIAIILTFIVGIAVMGSTVRAQGQMLFKTCRVELHNMGNARTRFELRADDPNTGLGFEFSLNGAALAQRQVIEPLPGAQQGATAASVPVVSQPTPAPAAAPAGSGGAGGAMKGALGFSGMMGELLSTIGYALPGGLGRGLLSLGNQMRSGQYVADRLQRDSKRVQSLPVSQASSVSPSASQATIRSQAAQPGTAPQAAGPTMGITRLWAQTPPVDPGQTLAVILTMRPIKSKNTQQYFFRVTAQAIDGEGVPPLIEQGSVNIKGLSFARRIIPFIVFLAMLGVVALLGALLAVNIGLLGQ